MGRHRAATATSAKIIGFVVGGAFLASIVGAIVGPAWSSRLGIVSPFAFAQGELSTVTLTLDRQTPWVRADLDPVLTLQLEARNGGGSAITDLSLAVTLGAPVRTRGEYDTSLTTGPVISSFREFPQDGSIDPGQTKTLGFTIDLISMGIGTTESLIYPLLVDLRSGGQPTGAVLRSPVLVLVRQPLQPLELQWTAQIAPAPAIGPNGQLIMPSFATSLAQGGVLRAEVDALGSLATASPPAAVDLAVSPRFLDELRRMSDGYTVQNGPTVAAGTGGAADAAAVLQTLRQIASSSNGGVTALPYAAPNLPALLGSGLSRDLDEQTVLGDQVFADVLGAAPSTTSAQVPAGALDGAVLNEIAGRSAGPLLAATDTILRPPDPAGLTLPPTGSLATSAGSMPVVLPDPGVQALLASPTTNSDPTLAAQQVLGEIAAVWQEAPSVLRGVAISTVGLSAPARFWESFARRAQSAPFLHVIHASRLVQDVPPPAVASPLASSGIAASFTRSYVEGIKQERRRIEALASMLTDPGDLPQNLDTSLLVAESAAFVGPAGEQAGHRWIDGVNTATGAVFAAATPTTAQQFTLTSNSGTIPVVLGDPGSRTLNAVIELSSSRLRFPQGATRTVRITEPNQIVTIPVQTAGTGQITVQVLVRAPEPSGRVVAKTTLVIRSTAYNRIALAVTIAAALVLVALWARRLFRRPTS